MSLYQVDHYLLFNMHLTYTKLWSDRIDDVTTGQILDSRSHVSELCMDIIRAYVEEYA